MIDLNDLIGVPYKVGGRSIEEGLDCYGLVKLVYLENLGVPLPDWQAEDDSTIAVSRIIKQERENSLANGTAKEIKEPEDYAIILTQKKHEAHHIGLYLHNGVLHSSKEYGTAYHSWWQFKTLSSGSKIRFYRWQV